MPNGGQIPGSSPGLRLQAGTPGVQDVGNANISGTLYATAIRTHLGAPGDPGNLVMGSQNYGGSPAGSQSMCTLLGENQTIGALGGNTLIGNAASSGSGAVASMQNSIGIGTQTMVTGFGNVEGSIAIGNQTTMNGGASIVIGSNSSQGDPSVGAGQIVIGNSSSAAAAGDFNIVIGYGSNDGGNNNFIRIGDGAPVLSVPNCICVGDNTHTSVQIGAYILTQMGRRLLLSTADAIASNTIVETAILTGGGAGTRTMFAANGATVGHTTRVHAAGRINTDAAAPTLLVKLKTDTGIILATSAAVLLPAGLANTVWEFDGYITVRTIGAGGTARAFGQFKYTTAAGIMQVVQLDQAAAVVIDTTIAQAINLYATWGTASPNNTITSGIGTLEVLQ